MIATCIVTDYGAVGDGVTDCTAAIANAINAIPASGGVLYFPPGTYVTGPQIWKSTHWWRGAGYEDAILKLKASSNANFIVSYNFASLTGTNSTGGIAGCGICDLTIDGNSSGNSSGNGLTVYGFGYTLQNIRIRNCAGQGFYSEWGTSSESSGYDAMEAVIMNFKIHSCKGDGVNFNGPHDSLFSCGEVYANGTSSANANMRFGNSANYASGGTQLSQVHCWGNSTGYAYILGDTILLDNCVGEGSTVAQCLILVDGCQLSGCWLFSADTVGCKGLVFGDATHTVYHCVVRAVINGCSAGVIDWTYAGDSNDVEVHSHADSPAGIIGSPSGTNHFEYYEHNGTITAANQYHFPGKTVIRSPASGTDSLLIQDYNGSTVLEISDSGNIGMGRESGINANIAQLLAPWADTMIGQVIVANSMTQSADLWQCQDGHYRVMSRFDRAGRLGFAAVGAVSAAAGANAGTNPPAPAVNSMDTDTRGNVTFGTGTSPSVGAMVVITFSTSFATAPFVTISPANSATAEKQSYVVSCTTTQLTIGFQTLPAASQPNTTYSINWTAIM